MATFQILPLELTWQIALELSDKDLCALASTSHAFKNALSAEDGYFWRRRFLSSYTLPQEGDTKSVTSEGLMRLYKARQQFVARPPSFAHASIGIQLQSLRLLYGIILDSFPSNGNWEVNMRFIAQFCAKSDLLLDTKYDYEMTLSPMRNVVVSILFPFALDSDVVSVHRARLGNAFTAAQAQMYGRTEFGMLQEVFFRDLPGPNSNLAWLQQAMIFWRWHLTKPQAHSLADAYSSLPIHERMSRWTTSLRKLQGPQPFGHTLLGTVGELTDRDSDIVPRARLADRNGAELADLFIAGDSFIKFHLTYKNAKDVSHAEWSDSLTSMINERLQIDVNYRQVGLFFRADANFCCARDRYTGDVRFEGRGWVHGMWSRVSGNWQRMVMQGYLFDATGTRFGHVEEGITFEAIVLPGGKIVVGQWHGLNLFFPGPFIMWNIDGPAMIVD